MIKCIQRRLHTALNNTESNINSYSNYQPSAQMTSSLLLPINNRHIIAPSLDLSPFHLSNIPPNLITSADKSSNASPAISRPLSRSQSKLLEVIQTGQNVYFTGKAGTGKTTLIHHFIKHATEMKKSFAILAPTGVSASLVFPFY